MGLRPRNVSEYAAILWRKKIFILLTAAVVLLATWIVIRRVPDLYEARALIVVGAGISDEARQTVATEITLISKQLESRPTLEALIQKYGLYPGLPKDAQIGLMRKALKSETKLRGYYPEWPESVTLTFQHTDPAVAQRVLNDVVTFFVGTNEQATRQAAEEARTVESKIAQVEGQLRSQDSRRPVRTGPDPQVLRAERAASAATVESLRDKQYGLERQIAEQKRDIAEQQKLVKATPPSRQTGAQGPLLLRKAELEGQLKDYATVYTDKNPKVVQARNQLAEVNQQLARLAASEPEADQGGTTEGRELRALQRDLSRMETELEVTQRELARRQGALANSPATSASAASSVEVGGQTGTAETAYLQNRYVSLLDRHDRLQMALSAPGERGLTPFHIVDPPNLPLSPVGPNRTRLELIGLALALAIGVGAAAMIEGPRLLKIRDEHDAEYFLGAPVIGLIPETLTPDERGHQRRLLLTRRLILICLAVVSVPLLAMLIYRLDLIQKIAYR